jgi:hypothetical protein
VNVAIEVTPEEEEAWLEKYADKYPGLVIVDEAGPLVFNIEKQRILLIGSSDDPISSFPIWKDEEFEDDLPPFRD